jgi:hypothetical protein
MYAYLNGTNETEEKMLVILSFSPTILEELSMSKFPKAASSTLAGINYRIARRYGERILDGHDCVHNENHLGLYFGKTN